MMLDLIGSAALTLAQAVGPDVAQTAVDVAQTAAGVAQSAVDTATTAVDAAPAVAAGAGALAGAAPGAVMPEAVEVGGQGVAHFIGQSDAVGKSLFVFLLLM